MPRHHANKYLARACLPRSVSTPQARPPATHVSAILFVVGAEFLVQGGLFIEHHKQMNANGDRRDDRNGRRIRTPEDDPQADPSRRKANIHGISNVTVKPTTTSRFGGMAGTGVPRPVHPKSHTHRSATAKPTTDGMAASQRQRAAPAVSTRKPSQRGSSQNHSAKNARPTASDAIADSHRLPCTVAWAGCLLAMDVLIRIDFPTYRVTS